MSPTLPLTAALSPLAAQHGIDLTNLASAEMAFNAMVKATLYHDDAAYSVAKARFDALTANAGKAAQ